VKLLAVDPGGTCGYAYLLNDDTVFASQLPPLEFLTCAHSWLSDFPEMECVVERYTITQRTIKLSRQSDALEVTGALRYLAHAYGGREIVLQQPADVMRLFTNDRLKELGWYVPGKEHACDALRHLGYRMTRSGQLALHVT